MCQRVTCPKCSKPSFTGCGRHVESVLADVPPADRCQCPSAAGAQEASPSDAVKRLFSWVSSARERRRP